MNDVKPIRLTLQEKFAGIISCNGQINYNDFQATLPVVLSDIRDFFPHLPATKSAFNRLETAINYNVPHMDKLRGYMLVRSYSELSNDHLSSDDILKSYILGWLVQIVQTPIVFMLDDYLDQDANRWGKPSWWNCISNRRMFVNDLFIMVHSVFPVLKYYFSEHPRYTEMIEFLNEATYGFVVGQDIDCQEQKTGDVQLSNFTKEARVLKWSLLNHKPVTLLPHQMALLLADVSRSDPVWKLTEDISYLLAEFGTFANDYSDCFNKSSGNADIRQGRLTYMVLRAKEASNEAQMKELVKYYGVDSDEAVHKVLTLYKLLGVKKWADQQMVKMEDKVKLQLKEMSAMPLAIASSMNVFCQSLVGEDGLYRC